MPQGQVLFDLGHHHHQFMQSIPSPVPLPAFRLQSLVRELLDAADPRQRLVSRALSPDRPDSSGPWTTSNRTLQSAAGAVASNPHVRTYVLDTRQCLETVPGHRCPQEADQPSAANHPMLLISVETGVVRETERSSKAGLALSRNAAGAPPGGRESLCAQDARERSPWKIWGMQETNPMPMPLYQGRQQQAKVYRFPGFGLTPWPSLLCIDLHVTLVVFCAGGS